MSDSIPKKVIKKFEKWWNNHGQYMRSGGGNYEKTFAYEAWVAAYERYKPAKK